MQRGRAQSAAPFSIVRKCLVTLANFHLDRVGRHAKEMSSTVAEDADSVAVREAVARDLVLRPDWHRRQGGQRVPDHHPERWSPPWCLRRQDQLRGEPKIAGREDDAHRVSPDVGGEDEELLDGRVADRDAPQ
jgi:hypothetical protein